MALVVSGAEAQTAPDADAVDSSVTEEVTVTAKKLDEARENISPALGANDYAIDGSAIGDQPQGEDRPLNQTLLQTPGFSQDSYGQLHVRNEHANLQYRINGIILPEGVSGFSQTFDSRFIDRIDILTGTLPAEYGYRTSGVVDITTKSGDFDQGGVADLYGGTHDTAEPSLQYGGSNGDFNYYLSDSYLHTGLGVENPTSSYNALHDDSDQEKGFAYLSQILSDTSRLSLIAGTSIGTFLIPDSPGIAPQYQAGAVADFNSATLNQSQIEYTHYALLALQGDADKFNYQLSPFVRYSQTRFSPDAVGDLVFNGFADSTRQSSTSSGVQFDSSYDLAAAHTLRSGYFISVERTRSDTANTLFPDTSGATNIYGNAQDTTTPLTIDDDEAKTGYIYGIYAQDEWKLSDELTVNYGSRFDIVNAFTDENQISPRLNAVYKPADGTTLHAGYARNFTPPPQELVASPSLAKFAGTTQAPAVTEDDPVKAEREHYFDVGADQTITKEWQAGLDGYYKIKRNLIDEGQFGESLLYSPFNYAFGRVYGLEGTTSYKLDAFTAYANLSYGQEKAKDIDSSQYFFSAAELAYIDTHAIHTDHDQKWTSSAGVNYQFRDSAGKLTPSLDAIFGSGLRKDPNDGMIDPNGAHLPSYWQFNAGLAQAFADTTGALKDTALRFDIINLTDRKYELRDGTGVGVGAPQFGPRRAFYVGVSKGF